MKILFMGTDGFAVPSLEKLNEKHEISAVITRRDKPRGRGRQVKPTPVKEKAEELGLKVLEPKSLNSRVFKEELNEIDYEIIVLVAYGRILPEDFIESPEKGSVCLHPSLLPEYRGCSPIECAILDGKETTGISVFYINAGVDTGDIIYQEEFEIKPGDTGGTLRERLSKESPDVLIKTLDLIKDGCPWCSPQDPSCSTYAPKLTKEDAKIDWTEPAHVIKNKIRAFNPKPGAFTHFRGKILKILWAEEIINVSGEKPGTIFGTEKGTGFLVGCGDGSLILTEVQPEGKKPMDAWSFVLGHKPEVGEKLGL